MGGEDAIFAMKAGQLDGFLACDPFGSQAEVEGIGKILATDYGYYDPEKSTGSVDDWGICCVYAMSEDFAEDYPELARRLVIAHGLSVQYLYEHPYNAAMMFAEGFGVDPEVGLRTVYLKTVAEGRTITWKFSEQNFINFEKEYADFDIPEEYRTDINDISRLMSTDILDDSGLEDFETFLEEEVDPVFPLGDSYEDWLEKAKAVDGIV